MVASPKQIANSIRLKSDLEGCAIDWKKVSHAINKAIIVTNVQVLHCKDTLGFISKSLSSKENIYVSNTISKEVQNVVTSALLAHCYLDTLSVDGCNLRKQDLEVLLNSSLMQSHKEFVQELLTPEERLELGLAGREWATSDEAGFTSKHQAERVINAFATLFETWEPREKYELINANEVADRVINHNLLY